MDSSQDKNDKSFYFSTVTKVDRLKAYKYISHQAPPVAIKARGQNIKIIAKAIGFNQNENVLECSSEDFKDWNKLEKVSLSFQVTTIQFYSKGVVKKDSTESIGRIKLDKELYMLERRSNFRLNIPFDIEAHLIIPIIRKGQIKEENDPDWSGEGLNSVFVIDDTTEQTVDNVFKQFMNLTNQEAKNEIKNYLKYPIKDISIGGIAFICPEEDQRFLEKGHFFKKIKIMMAQEEILVTKAEIAHIQKVRDPESEHFKLSSKIALKFLEVDEENENKIFKFLTKEVSKQDLLLNFEEAIL